MLFSTSVPIFSNHPLFRLGNRLLKIHFEIQQVSSMYLHKRSIEIAILVNSKHSTSVLSTCLCLKFNSIFISLNKIENELVQLALHDRTFCPTRIRASTVGINDIYDAIDKFIQFPIDKIRQNGVVLRRNSFTREALELP